MSISKSLLRAAKIQEKIDLLRGQLSELLDQARAEVLSTMSEETYIAPRRGRTKPSKGLQSAIARRGVVKVKPTSQGQPARRAQTKRRSPLAGLKRATSPSGPLAPAVVKVLQAKKQAMNVRDILDGLLANGYKFSTPEPKKNLAARIYKLKGVKQVSSGLFGLA